MWLVDLVERAGFVAEALTRQLPVDLAALTDIQHRVDWDVFALLCEQVEKLFGSREALCEAAGASLEERFDRLGEQLGGGFNDPSQIYWLAHRWVGPQLLPDAIGELLEGDPIRLRVTLPEHIRECPQLMPLIACALERLPRIVGRPHALVDVEGDARSGVFAISAPAVVTATAEQPLRASEAQRMQSQKMEAIGRLADGIAHDFNNLLTAINGYSDLIIDELGPDHVLRADAEEILRAAERAGSLTRQLLSFSRREALSPTLIDLNALVSDVDRLLRRLIGEDIELVTSLGGDPEHIRADPGRIEQLIMNLAVNARDAMPAGGRLTLTTDRVDCVPESSTREVRGPSGPHVLLSVSDTGVGMDSATTERIFEPFFTTRDPGQGTGLGLSAVYGIVQQNDGRIHVSSTPGAGTTFSIYLPVADESAGAEPDEVFIELRGDETILLVEDEESVRRLLRRGFEKHGYAVVDACSGVEALRILERREHSFDLLVTDVILPRMSGVELARITPGLRTLFISGFSDDALTDHLARSKDHVILHKPFSAKDLLRTARGILNAPVAPDAPAASPAGGAAWNIGPSQG